VGEAVGEEDGEDGVERMIQDVSARKGEFREERGTSKFTPRPGRGQLNVGATVREGVGGRGVKSLVIDKEEEPATNVRL
jgi:hypothetical protein